MAVVHRWKPRLCSAAGAGGPQVAVKTDEHANDAERLRRITLGESRLTSDASTYPLLL